MCSCQYRHLIRQSLLPSFEIIDIKNVCVLDHFGCHQPYDLPQMTVATFRYLALAFMYNLLKNLDFIFHRVLEEKEQSCLVFLSQKKIWRDYDFYDF